MKVAGLGLRSPARHALLTVVAPTLLAVIAGSVPTTAATLPEVRGGRLAGPLPIAGGTQLRAVARLPLGAGDWTVLAKGVVRNTTPDLFVVRRATCVLSLGSVATPTQVTPIGADDASRTIPFLITVSRRLARPGVALLRCKVPGSATGALTIGDIRLEAMRTAALWTAGITGPYVRHGARTSATLTVERHASSAIPVPDLPADLAAIDVPAGSWTFLATGYVVGGTGVGHVDCALTAGDEDHVSVPIDPAGTIADRRPFSLQMVHVFPAGGSAWLRCFDGLASSPTIAGLRIVAIRARTLDNASLAVAHTYPGLGGATRPVVDAGYLDGPVVLTPDGAPQIVAKMKLPPGRWLVLAKLTVDETTNEGWPAVTCRLDTGDGTDRTGLRLAAYGTVDHVQPAMLAWHGRLVTGAQVNLVCTNDAPAVEASWIKLTAYLAGTMSTVPIRVR